MPIDQVTEWMVRHRDRPMFVYVHTAEPHAPYEAPPPFRDKFDPDYDGPIDGTYDKLNGFQEARAPRDIQHVVALYHGEVAFADYMFGRFMRRLEELGLRDNLLTVVTADHGEQFQEHGRWKHGESSKKCIDVFLLVPPLNGRNECAINPLLNEVGEFKRLFNFGIIKQSASVEK